MKISRDYLKKIISEEIKSILKEAFSPAQQEYINNFTSFTKKNSSAENWTQKDVENLVNFTPTSGSMTPDEKINATIEAYRKIGMEPGVDSLPSAHMAALLPLTGFVKQWGSIGAMRVASGKMPDAKQDKSSNLKDLSTRVKEYVVNLKKMFADQKTIEVKSAEEIANALNYSPIGGPPISNKEKVVGLVAVFGSEIGKWPHNVREYTVGSLDPDLTQTVKNMRDSVANIATTKQPEVISLEGTKGYKCNHATTVQQKAVSVLEKLASQTGIDKKYLSKLKSRLSDGIMGNTTLGIMKVFSNGKMSNNEYPLNNTASYKKACRINKEDLSSILNAMNLETSLQAIVDEIDPKNELVAESKKIQFKKALKAAILKEMKKNS